MITVDEIFVDTSESGFVKINYIQTDDGIDMGGRLCIEQASVPKIIKTLHGLLNNYGQGKVEFDCGNDSFRIYESGPDQQLIYNTLNRRAEGVSNSGLTGLMMTGFAAKDLIKQLLILAPETNVEPVDETPSLNQQLLEAAEKEDLNVIKNLLDRGADVNFFGKSKQSALNIAAERGHLYAVAVLLAAGANIENPDVADKTPLMGAAFAGKTKVVNLLLRYGALINRDLINTLQLKVDISTENFQPETAQAWQSFLDFMIEKWNSQEK
ncbi:MAG: ankyrin repeat domain-containing protein [Pyrinomonadaceae bacterium]